MHRFAVLTAGATLALILAGGLVTSTGSGLAVPDWPLSYGQLMPPMVGGVLYEHGHRMVAATVGFLMLVLAVWVLLREPRRWVGWLAAAALGAVVLQGILGGLTVLFLLPAPVSVLHACLAQAFFCLTVTLAVVTGPSWQRMPAASPAPRTAQLRTLSIVLVGTVYLQLVLGAIMRHTGAGLAIPDFPLSFGRLVPPLDSAPVAIHFAHRAWGVLVAGLALWMSGRALAARREEPLLARPAGLLGFLVIAQVLLGGLTVWTGRAVTPTTAHVATGAAVLAVSLVLALRVHRRARQAAAVTVDPARRAASALSRQGQHA